MPDHAGHEISVLKVAGIFSRKRAERAATKGASEGTLHARDQRLG
jgi:hypothetical protein